MNLRRDYMENINLERHTTVEEFNEDPVYYCTKCMSLKIKSLNSDIDYCDDCGSTDIETTDIYTWEKMYKERYGKEF
jgi:ribosomal protein L37AE/L43A